MRADPAFDAVAVHHDARASILLCGELDLEAVPHLNIMIDRVLGDPMVDRIGIDALLVTFCDAASAGALVGAWATAHRCGVAQHLVRYSPPLARVIALTGLTRLLLEPLDIRPL
ncbi:STAS domain-containing protein [Streptacidiphilus sp. PAMC 29251]